MIKVLKLNGLQTVLRIKVIAPATFLTAAHRKEMVQRAALGFRTLYVDQAKGEERANFILRKLERGGYDSYDRPFPFTEQLAADLQPTPRDLHFEVRHSVNPIPPDDVDRSLQELKEEELTPSQSRDMQRYLEREREELREINFGVGPSRMIEGTKIGYVKMTCFARDFKETYEKIDEAMRTVKDATGLIIDLRGNWGGNPKTVARLASYLFDEKTLLNRVYYRLTNSIELFCGNSL